MQFCKKPRFFSFPRYARTLAPIPSHVRKPGGRIATCALRSWLNASPEFTGGVPGKRAEQIVFRPPFDYAGKAACIPHAHGPARNKNGSLGREPSCAALAGRHQRRVRPTASPPRVFLLGAQGWHPVLQGERGPSIKSCSAERSSFCTHLFRAAMTGGWLKRRRSIEAELLSAALFFDRALLSEEEDRACVRGAVIVACVRAAQKQGAPLCTRLYRASFGDVL